MTTRILETARSILEGAEYSTTIVGATGTQFIFEDTNVYGFVTVAEPLTISQTWEALQDTFLRKQASVLSKVPEKAWNLYAVFLSGDPCPDDLTHIVDSIEEDFRGTRKIARCGLDSRDSIEVALAPLLPLKHARPLAIMDLQDRLTTDPGVDHHLKTLLESGMDTKQIVAELLER